MRRLYTLLSPVPVFEHYHSAPKLLVLYDSLMFSASLSRLEKMRLAAKPPLDVTVAARAVYNFLIKHTKHSKQEIEVAVMIAATRSLRGSRPPIDRWILEKAKEILDDASSIGIETIAGYETVVSPVTLLEYLTSPVETRKVLPPTLMKPTIALHTQIEEKLSEILVKPEPVEPAVAGPVVEKLFDEHAKISLAPLTHEKLCEMADKLARAIEAEEKSSTKFDVAALRARMTISRELTSRKEALATALTAVSQPVLNVITTRTSANDSPVRGQKTQGNAGWATGLIQVDECDPLTDPAAELVRAAERVGTGILSKFKLLTRMWRRDRRFNDIWLPGPTPTPKNKPVVVVGVDVSGSINRRELSAFISTLKKKILPHVDRERSLVLFWSTRIEKAEKLANLAEEDLVPSGGGTDPASFLEYVDKLEADGVIQRGKHVVILLSDGEFDVYDELAEGFKRRARKAALAYAVITYEEETASKLRELGWYVEVPRHVC